MSSLVDQFNKASSTQVCLGTLTAVGLMYYGPQFVNDPKEFINSLLGSVISKARTLPGIKGAANKEINKIIEDLRNDLKIKDDPNELRDIPEEGWSHEKLLEVCTTLRENEVDLWRAGKVSGVVYHGGQDHVDIQNKIYGLFALTNPLHPDVFPSIRKFESEILAMAREMLHGTGEVCGAVTSGGTESILMAMKAHRDYYAVKRGITKPEILAPVSAHAAFDKAAHYFGIKLVHCKLNSDYSLDVEDMKKKINSNTICLVGSAPSYAHGIIDDITTIAGLAKKHNIGCHVDGCLGGFILPWFQRVAEIDSDSSIQIPPFDFAVDGVTSMSADTHKYGYSVKGTSVVLFRTRELREHMYFVQPDWTGGIYASPSIAGSRPGGLIAACWASLVATGKNGFISQARDIWRTKEIIKKGIAKQDHLDLIGDSHSTVVGFTSKSINIFGVLDGMKERGWNLNALQKPDSVHICVTYKHVENAQVFLTDLAAAVEEVLANPDKFKKGAAHIYGLAHGLPDRSIVTEIVFGFLNACLDPL